MVKIEEYTFGRIKIDGKIYERDVIIGWDAIINSNWWRKEGHYVQLDDIKDLLNKDIEVIIFGTGAYGVCRVSNEVIEEFKKRGVKVIVCPTREAVQKFNEFVQKGKKVIACLHLTC